MLNAIGLPGLILILIFALIVFGPSKLPEIGKAVGSSLMEFKKAVQNIDDQKHNENKKNV